MKKLVLIDGNSLLFRAYYATAYGGGVIMSSSDGTPTNAIYALSGMIKRIMESTMPDYALVAFDTGKPTFRHNQYAEYKAGRKEAPSELKIQFPLARQLMQLYGFMVYEKDGYEADDIIGTVAKLGSKADFEVQIYSGDRDLLQLIDHNTTVYLTKKGVSEIAKMDTNALMQEYEIAPNQVPDLKGLMGDASDNIPGIKGIGEKTAIKLLKQYQNLETILAAPHEGKLKEKIDNARQDGILSKELATIYCDLPLEFTLEGLSYHGPLLEDLKTFFIKYEMRSLLVKMPVFVENKQTIQASQNLEINYQEVDNLSLQQLQEIVSLEVIFSHENVFEGIILGFAMSSRQHHYYIDYEKAIQDSNFLHYLRSNEMKKSGLNIKRMISGLKYRHIEVAGFDFDLLLAVYLLDTKVKEDPSSIFSFFGISLPGKNEIWSKKNIIINEDMKRYSCMITKALVTVKENTLTRLKEYDLINLFNEIEMPLTFVLADMEVQGVKVDVNILDQQAAIIQKKQAILEGEIIALAGQEFNINSPSQMANILFDVLNLSANRKRSTAVEYLEALKDEHPIIGKILLQRKYAKLLSNYLVGLKSYIRDDGKLHTIFNQALTQTGRLSSSEPNLQNISVRDKEAKEVRKAFVPSSLQNYLLSLDYSQIELRVLAALAEEEILIESFANGEDIHARTASQIFNCRLDEVSDEMRRQAKVVNFGILYGMSDWGLGEEIGVPPKVAKEYIAKYFDSFPKIKQYLDEVVQSCEKLGYVKTMMNRVRHVPEIMDKNYNIREFGKRVAMNSPIQGGAADIIKLAMINVARVLREGNYQTKMILQVHDELIFEVPYDEIMLVIPLISEAMENAVNLKVKMEVEYEYGATWFDC